MQNIDNQWNETQGYIKCCMCGIPIPSNPSNMCVNCIRNQVDITDGICKQMHINQCRGCSRYLVPPNQWAVCDLESKELLTVCVKKIKGLKAVKLIDASFVYTEPHSKRLKVKLTIQKEVFIGTILQQAFIVEYMVMNQQCSDCERFEAKDTWNAVVQLRQKTDHKKTFFWLEQLILKHNAHSYVSKMKEMSDGLDFFFSTRQHAKKFSEFIFSVVPVRQQISEKLISSDVKSNTANYKFSYSVEIVPICRDDFVCLPTALVKKLGGVTPLYIVSKVTNSLHLIDPRTLKTIVIPAQVYWNFPFKPLNSKKDLVEFMVLDVRPTGPKFGKFALAEIQLAKIDEMSSTDKSYFGYTHLGNILECGSHVWGYLTETCVYNDSEIQSLKGHLPSVVVISKSYPKRQKKKNARYWKLKSMTKDEDQHKKNDSKKREKDYEEFLDDLDKDPELRSEINLYRVPNTDRIYNERNNKTDEMQDSGEDDDDDGDEDDFPEVKLSELMNDMSINNENN